MKGRETRFQKDDIGFVFMFSTKRKRRAALCEYILAGKQGGGDGQREETQKQIRKKVSTL